MNPFNSVLPSNRVSPIRVVPMAPFPRGPVAQPPILPPVNRAPAPVPMAWNRQWNIIQPAAGPTHRG